MADTLYMLICPPRGPNRLAYWSTSWKKDHAWKDLALQGPPADGNVLAMLTVGGRLTLLSATPREADPDADPPPRVLHIDAYEGPEKGFSDQIVTHKDEPMTWRRPGLLLATAMGDRYALFWSDDSERKFAQFGLNGKVIAVSTVDILDRPPLDNDGPAILEKLMWALVGGVLFSVFVLRPRAATRSFVIAPHLRPAPLGRRVLAVLVDAVLVNILATLVFSVTSGPMTPEELERTIHAVSEGQAIPARAAYAIVVSAASLAAYGFFLERRFGGTAGKLLLRLRVVGLDGLPLGVREAILRNLIKLFELIPLLWPMLLIPLFNRSRLRLGDIVARTIVVESASVRSLPAQPTDQPPGSGAQPPPDDPDSDQTAPRDPS